MLHGYFHFGPIYISRALDYLAPHGLGYNEGRNRLMCDFDPKHIVRDEPMVGARDTSSEVVHSSSPLINVLTKYMIEQSAKKLKLKELIRSAPVT